MTCIPTSNSHTFTGDGVTTNISFTFKYQNISDIKVRTGEFPDFVDVPTTAYSIDPANPTVVVFNPAPTNGVEYTIYRCTDDDALIATFQAGSAIRAGDLNDNFEQMLFITQDASNRSFNLEGNVEVALEDAAAALDKANEAIDRVEDVEDRMDDLETAVDDALDQIREVVDYKVVPNVVSINTVFPSPQELDGCQVTDSTGIENYTPLTGLPTGFVGDPGLGVRILYRGTSWEFINVLVNDPDGRFINANGDNVTGDYTIGGSISSDTITGGTISGANYEGTGFTLGALNDVSLSGITNGQTIIYNAATNSFEPGEGGGGGSGGGIDSPPATIPGSSISLQPADLSTDDDSLEFSTDGGQTWATSITSSAGDIINVRWTESAFDTTGHDQDKTVTLTYAIVNGNSTDQVYTYHVDKEPTPFNFAGVADADLNTPVASPTNVTLSGINARVRAWATSVNATNPQLEINGTWTSIADTPGDTVLIPNNTPLRFRHTTSSNITEVATTTLYIGWDQNAGNFASDTYTTTNVDAGVDQPTILNIPNGTVDVALGLTIQSSAFSGIGPVNTHVSTDWQLATDSAFTNIAHQSIGDTVNKTSWSPNYAHGTEFWLRVRYNGSSPAVVSEWSPVINFTSINAYIANPVIATPTQNGDVDQNGTRVVTQSISGVEYGTHESTDWQISKQSDFSTIYVESLGDTTNLTEWTGTNQTDTDNETLYIRVRFHGSAGISSDWSDVRTCTGARWYSWKFEQYAWGAGGGTGSGAGGSPGSPGRGCKTTTTWMTSQTSASPPGNYRGLYPYAGQAGTSGRGGHGGASCANYLNGQLVGVGGGGGGGGEESGCKNGGSGRTQVTADSDRMDNTGNPPKAGTHATGWGGSGGDPGTGGQSQGCGGSGGGSWYQLGDHVINQWYRSGVSTNNGSNGSGTRHTIYRRYKSGSWQNVGSASTNASGDISSLITTRSLAMSNLDTAGIILYLMTLSTTDVRDSFDTIDPPNVVDDENSWLARTDLTKYQMASRIAQRIHANNRHANEQLDGLLDFDWDYFQALPGTPRFYRDRATGIVSVDETIPYDSDYVMPDWVNTVQGIVDLSLVESNTQETDPPDESTAIDVTPND